MKVSIALQREAALRRDDLSLDHGKARLSTIRQAIADRHAARQFVKRQKELVRALEAILSTLSLCHSFSECLW